MHHAKIDCLMPRYSRYSVLHHFMEKLYEAFQRAGHSCRLLTGEEQFLLSAESPPDFTIGFNGAFINQKHEFFCDQIKVPHVSVLVDPPYHYSYLVESPNIIISCDDRMGCRLLDSWNFHHNFFLPHAVEHDLAPDPSLARVFDVVMLATFIDDKKCLLEWEKNYPPEICKMMLEATEMALTTPISFIQACSDLFQKLRQKSATGKYDALDSGKLLMRLERYVKSRDRIQLAESVTDLPLHIFGSALDTKNWDSHFENLGKKNVLVHAGITYQSALRVMKQAKIVLNPSIKNRDGTHERFFSGTACGALVVTNESRFLREQFQENEIYYYHHQNPQILNSTIANMLSDETKRVEVVNKVRLEVMQSHTWDKRAAQILHQLKKFI